VLDAEPERSEADGRRGGDRRVVLDAGSSLVWKSLQRGCPHGSVLGPFLWNVLFDDVLDTQLPPRCDLIAYADDLLLLVGQQERDRK